jgi:glycosyltransferase involved in cell wall biosynthesis
MNQKRKIAFIKWGSFSHINVFVHQILERHFPQFHIDVIDIDDLVPTRNPRTYLACLRDYGKDLLTGRRNIYDARVRTSFTFHEVRKAILALLDHDDYAFTFQTQSMFDASKPGVPHFVYTDCTYLAHLQFPGFSRRDLPCDSWMECEKQIYSNATKVFTMSENVSKSLIDDYSCHPEKIDRVNCGANVKVSEDQQFDDARYAGKRILFVGVDWERKGGPALLDAFETVLETHPDATLTVVGCSPRIDLPNCNVVGRVPLAEVKKYFEEASLFCLPTLIEPFGIVFLEAMAHGLPIVATNMGAIPDFVIEGQSGSLVEANHPLQLAQQISMLLADPKKLQSFGEFGRRLFWQQYTWEHTGVRISEQVERVLAGNSGLCATPQRDLHLAQ